MSASCSQIPVFLPNADRAIRIDQDVRDGLSDSLALVFDRLGSLLTLDADHAAEVLRLIRAHPSSPWVMATYTDLVEALYADDSGRARSLIDDFFRGTPNAGALRAVTLTDQDLGVGQAERYARYASAESVNLRLAAVSEDVKARVADLMESAMSLLEGGAPELAREIRALVRELVLVEGADASESFDGATTFYLWGALFLNANRLHNRVQLAVAIIHEAAHAFLFGINMGARLTENPDAELCRSPLRVEPRPIEGVFHANFVLARMIYGLDLLLASDLLRPEERAQAEGMLRQNAESFDAGAQSLAGVVKLTALGAQLMSEAEAYVSRFKP